MRIKVTQAVLLSQATWSEISSSIARITHLMICGTTLEIDAVDTCESINDFVLEIKLLFFCSQLISLLCFWVPAPIPVAVDQGGNEQEEKIVVGHRSENQHSEIYLLAISSKLSVG